MADFEKVVAQYPKSIDARRELGISYYQRHRYDEPASSSRLYRPSSPTIWRRITTWL